MKTWQTPRLIVLVRGNPEEAVLYGCKWHMLPGGPAYANVNCYAVRTGVLPDICIGECSSMHNT